MWHISLRRDLGKLLIQFPFVDKQGPPDKVQDIYVLVQLACLFSAHGVAIPIWLETVQTALQNLVCNHTNPVQKLLQILHGLFFGVAHIHWGRSF